MAENKKFDNVPVTVQTNPTDKFFKRKMPSQTVEPKSSWSWREKFLRGIGVAFLYGNVIKQVPVEDLKLMIGACAEGERGAFMMMLALLQLIRELTVVPRLQRPRRSLRDRVRRMRTYWLLARVLYNIARECHGNMDDLVQRVISILHPQDNEELKADVDQKVDNQQEPDGGNSSDLERKVEELEKKLVEQANVQRNLMEMLGEAKMQVGKAEDAAKKLDAKLQGETKADADDDQKVDKQSRRGIIATKQDRRAACIAVKMPDTTDNQDTGDWSWLEESGEDSQSDGKESEEQPTVLVDNAALQRLCDEHYEGDIIVPISVARDKVGKSKSLAEAWVQQIAEEYGLSVRLGFMPAEELPKLSKSQKESGLSANDCLTVRYGLGVAMQDCPEIARVEFDNPAIKSFYMEELDKLLAKRAKRA